jgi:hypothetical protein
MGVTTAPFAPYTEPVLPGGSPGPDAQGSWRTLLLVTVFALAAAGVMLWFFFHVVGVMSSG